ncbi:MAG: beta strand repeat-containing protein, partial [Planctomycetota bacterium]
PLSLTVGNASILYGNTTTFSALPSTFSTGVGTQTLSLTYASAGNTGSADAGSYALTATAANSTGLVSNYDVAVTNGKLTVGRRPVTLNVGNVTIAYGNTTTFASLPGSLSTGVGTQSLAVTYASAGNTGAANVGAYSITATAADGTGRLSNYDASVTNGVLTVGRRSVPFTIGNVSIPYGDTTTFASLPSFLSTGVGTETLSLTYSSSGNSGTANAGAYSIFATAADGSGMVSNYNVTFTTGTLTVGRRPLSFTVGDVSIVYGNTTNFSGLPNSLSTGVGSQTLALTYSSVGNTGVANAGAYSITATANSGSGLVSNYNVTFANGTLTVGRRPLSLTVGDVSIVYGDTTNFASLPSTSPTGVGTQTLSLTYSSAGNTGAADVGFYASTVTAASGTGLVSNYDITVTNGTLKVGRRPVTVTIGTLAKDLGAAIDLSSRLPSTVASGVANQSLSIKYVSTGAVASAPAGKYPITGTVGDGSGLLANYLVAVVPGELQVVGNVVVLAADANSMTLPYVRVVSPGTGATVSKFLAYESTFRGGVRVMRADLTGDGVDEIITAPGRGRAPEVRVFSLSGTPLTEYNTMAYAATMVEGISIVPGDVDGDGRVDIVTVPSRGRAEVRLFLNQRGTNADPMANIASRSFLAFPASFTGGAVLALADMGQTRSTGFVPRPDGKPEILVGSGPGMRAMVRFFDVTPTTPVLVRTTEFFASTFFGGIASLAVGRANICDVLPDVIASAGSGGNSAIEIRDGHTTTLIKGFAAYTNASRGAPVRLIARDTNNDNLLDEIWTVQGAAGNSRQISRFRLDGSAVDSFLETDADLRGEYFLA